MCSDSSRTYGLSTFCQTECKEASPFSSSSLEGFPPLLSEPKWLLSYQKVERAIQPANIEWINSSREMIHDIESRR